MSAGVNTRGIKPTGIAVIQSVATAALKKRSVVGCHLLAIVAGETEQSRQVCGWQHGNKEKLFRRITESFGSESRSVPGPDDGDD